MEKRRIAIACQGGGSQCAFVAGALRTLLAQGVQQRYQIVGLSGTSGGALTAAVAWYGLLKQAQGDPVPVEARILDIWRDLTAQSPLEIAIDQACVQGLRLTERGLLPTLASSPSTPRVRFMTETVSALVGRPEFTDLRVLLQKHIDFDALPALITEGSPALLVGAADILEGTFKIFSSVNREIKVEALLASAAIPNLFPAVWVDGHAYWDGIFASNPPVLSFLRRPLMGPHHRPPEEIWIIQVNRARHPSVPETPSDIFDRRNHLAGNLSLQHELQVVEMMNLILAERALTDEFRARFGLDATEAIGIRFIRMSEGLQRNLDYPSKLSRQPAHIARLLLDGEAQATAFLRELEATPDALAEEFPSVSLERH